MTATTMDLRELLEKTAATDCLRDMIGFTVQRLMELEVETLSGAVHGSRNADRLAHRNGHRERDWETRAGTIDLRIPKIRDGNLLAWPMQRLPVSDPALQGPPHVIGYGVVAELVLQRLENGNGLEALIALQKF